MRYSSDIHTENYDVTLKNCSASKALSWRSPGSWSNKHSQIILFIDCCSLFLTDWVDSLIDPGGLLLVIFHPFAVPVFLFSSLGGGVVGGKQSKYLTHKTCKNPLQNIMEMMMNELANNIFSHPKILVPFSQPYK
jgi:hypothetical protein